MFSNTGTSVHTGPHVHTHISIHVHSPTSMYVHTGAHTHYHTYTSVHTCRMPTDVRVPTPFGVPHLTQCFPRRCHCIPSPVLPALGRTVICVCFLLVMKLSSGWHLEVWRSLSPLELGSHGLAGLGRERFQSHCGHSMPSLHLPGCGCIPVCPGPGVGVSPGWERLLRRVYVLIEGSALTI